MYFVKTRRMFLASFDASYAGAKYVKRFPLQFAASYSLDNTDCYAFCCLARDERTRWYITSHFSLEL